nr:unnamed protein product [Meloidogyne enterolobii]
MSKRSIQSQRSSNSTSSTNIINNFNSQASQEQFLPGVGFISQNSQLSQGGFYSDYDGSQLGGASQSQQFPFQQPPLPSMQFSQQRDLVEQQLQNLMLSQQSEAARKH